MFLETDATYIETDIPSIDLCSHNETRISVIIIEKSLVRETSAPKYTSKS